MDRILDKARWVVGKALASTAGGVLEAWAASRNFGLNVEALKMELLLVQAMLEQAGRKELSGPAMEMLLQKLRDSAHNAEDLLDELDYFRIQDELHCTYEAADEFHGEGCCLHNLVLNACHTAKAIGKQLESVPACCSAATPGQTGEAEDARVRGNSSSAPNANQDDEEEVSGCVGKLGKLFPCSSSPHPHAGDYNHGNVLEAPKLEFNRVEFSQRMKDIGEKLQLVRNELNRILRGCGPRTVSGVAQSRPVTTAQSVEPKLYGRDHVMDSIIHDITKGQYLDKDLTVLPVVGLGGMGKTTLIQYIYHNQQVHNHFPVKIWICVSFNLNLDKVLDQVKRYTPAVESEKAGSTTEELIKQRLRSRRFLLVLDDIWQISNEDEWRSLLRILNQSQEKGCIILVTTRFQAIAEKVKTTDHSIELTGLESEVFRKLFLAFVFGDEQYRMDHYFLLETGDKIMEKLEGSPLAAKTVGRLLRRDLSLSHWKRVLKSKEWEKQTSDYEIMPALKLSYDFLPFHLQQCFSHCALFPEDYCFRSHELINLWIGLGILIPSGQNQTFEDMGLRNLNELVIYGFLKEEENDGDQLYVMHDLLHDLALNVAAPDCLSLCLPNVGSIEIQPTTRHLSISAEDLGEYDVISGEKLESELEEMKTILKVEHLQTLMLFGQMDEGFAKIFGDFLLEANALRVLYLPDMLCTVESMLHNFSELVHLRYLCLGTKEREMHLPLSISKFYHLRILDLESWDGSRDLPGDMSNLANLCHIHILCQELHSCIYNVGKLKLLEELKVFEVNKKGEGHEPKQLEHLAQLRELGIYNLEKMHTEEAAQAKLIEKNHLKKLTLDWDCERSSVDLVVEPAVLESLQPHEYLQELCIRGHGGPSCPTWLGDNLAVEALQSLFLVGVSWKVLPSVGKMSDLRKLVLKHIGTVKEFVTEQSFCRLIWFELVGLENFEKWVPSWEAHHMFPLLQVLIIRDCPKLLEFRGIDWFPILQELEIQNCPKLSLVPPIPWTGTLYSVSIRGAMLLEKLVYSNSSHGVRLDIVGNDDLHSLDQVLTFSNLTGLEKLTLVKCPPLELKHLLFLTSLKTLSAESSDALVEPLGGQGVVEWKLPVEHIEVRELCDNSGKELTKLLTHFPRLSKLEIMECGKITHLAVAVGLQLTTSAASKVENDEIPAAAEWEKDGMLLFPALLSNTLKELVISHCPELVLVASPTLHPDGSGELQALRCLQRLRLKEVPKFLSAYLFASPSCHLFPSSLQFLELNGVEGMGTVEPLSNLTSLTLLELRNCGEDLRCKGLGPLLTAGGQLSELIVYGSPRFFAGWELQLVCPPSSSKLQKLWTDDVTGFLASPICSLLSSSLTQLQLSGTKEMERFSNKQEEALHLLNSLLKLEFYGFDKLQNLPTGLHKLTYLKELQVSRCPSVRSLPKDGLPKFLQKLDVWDCGSEKLIHQCRGLMGIFSKIRLEF